MKYGSGFTMMFGAVGVADIRLGRIGGEKVHGERAKVPVPVGVEDGLEATVVEFVEEEVLLFGEVAKVMFVLFVQITLCVLHHHCVALECIGRDDSDFVFNKCAAFEVVLVLDRGGRFVLGFVAEADEGVPKAEALGLDLGLAAKLDGLRC